jgi:hypothetical protein
MGRTVDAHRRGRPALRWYTAILLVLVLIRTVPAGVRFILAYKDVDSIAVRKSWTRRVPGVTLAQGVRVTIGKDSGRVHYHRITETAADSLRADLQTKCSDTWERVEQCEE